MAESSKKTWLDVISIVISIIALAGSMWANRYAKLQAESAKLEHYPYVAIVSHSDNGNKQHGIYIHNYASGLAIIDSIVINKHENPKLTTEKWQQILKGKGFNDNENACFSFAMPYKGMGLSGHKTVPLIFVSSENEKNIENSGGVHLCNSKKILEKLENNLDIKIGYKSRLPDSKVEVARVFKLWN